MLQDAAHRRLGDVNQPRRAADAAGQHDGVKYFYVAKAHGLLLFFKAEDWLSRIMKVKFGSFRCYYFRSCSRKYLLT